MYFQPDIQEMIKEADHGGYGLIIKEEFAIKRSQNIKSNIVWSDVINNF